MKIKKMLKLFCTSCCVGSDCKNICRHHIKFKKLLEEKQAKKKPKIIKCPNCFCVFPSKELKGEYQKKPASNPEGFEITNEMKAKALHDIEKEKETLKAPGLKILVQLEIEYEKRSELNHQIYYPDLIREIKTYFENGILIPETDKIKFKHLDKVRISKIIQ